MRAAGLYLSKVNECGGFRFAPPPPFQRFLTHKDISEILRFSEISCSDKKKKKGLRGQWRGENHFFFFLSGFGYSGHCHQPLHITTHTQRKHSNTNNAAPRCFVSWH